VTALGANPTPLPFPELYAALEQKAVDGQENPVATIKGAKLYEVQKYMTLTNHQYNPQSVVVSKRFWDTLAPADRKILQEAAQESTAYQRTQSRAMLQSGVEDLRKSGMEITELPPAEVAKLREKMKPVIAKHSATVGDDTVKAMMAELARLRK
jgi:TRAP-type C4-dicarboxylate transport system substrate-binding protein